MVQLNKNADTFGKSYKNRENKYACFWWINKKGKCLNINIYTCNVGQQVEIATNYDVPKNTYEECTAKKITKDEFMQMYNYAQRFIKNFTKTL